MDTMPYKLLVADTENSALLLINGESGEIQNEWPLPQEYTPLDICLSPDGNTAYIPTRSSDECSALFILSMDAGLSQLPLKLPSIERFAVGPTAGQAILTTRDGSLFLLDINNLSLSLIGRCATAALCVGLAVDLDTVYTVWQQDGSGVLAILTSNGDLLSEQHLPCLPTSLSQSVHNLYIPFTTVEAGNEGMLLLKKGQSGPPSTISLHWCPDETAFRIHPCYVAVSPDESLAYVVHEDSVNISVVDTASATISGHIPLGRSISCLALLPDAKFAIAGSNMFADLSLIDLVNQRLLSFTDREREILAQVAVIP